MPTRFPHQNKKRPDTRKGAVTMLHTKKIAVIGAGRIGQVFVRELSKCSSQVYATARSEKTLKIIKQLGGEAFRDNKKASEKADIVIISVKPYQFPSIVDDLKETVSNKILISVLAGVNLNTIKETFPNAKIFRAMPNINAFIRKSTTALTYDPSTRVSEEDRRLVEQLFKCIGSVYWIPEEYMDTWTSLIGSTPAFLAEIIDALVLGAVMTGMPRHLAQEALLDAVKATMEHLQTVPVHPLELRDEVTTPGGTTIYGLKLLEARGVKAGLMEVIVESTKRGAELGRVIEEGIKKSLTKMKNQT